MPRFGFALWGMIVAATAQAHDLRVVMSPAEPSAPNALDRLIDGGEGMRLDRILLQRQQECCRQDRIASPPPTRSAAADLYIKQTEFDNTPYRFNMTQNGQRMTADDFDAWLQSNGYSVGDRIKTERLQE